jgi:Uma2 family endonuclease
MEATMAVPKRKLTLEEFLELPEEEPALEYEEGTVTQKVSPKGKHSRLQGWMIKLINTVTEPRKLAMAFPELRFATAQRSPVPDVAVYLWDRIPRDERGRVADNFREAPDIAIEIVSPEQSVNSLIRRCLWYVAHGVRLALLVDPKDESVLVFRPNQIPSPRRGADRIDFDDVLPGLTMTVDELFASLTL